MKERWRDGEIERKRVETGDWGLETGNFMNRDDVLFLIQYHNRTNKTIFEMAGLLTEEELMRGDEFDKGSAFDSLRHLVDVDWSWRQFCNGNDVGKSYLWELGPMSNFAEGQ